MLKKIIFVQTMFLCLFNLNAQIQENLKLAIKMGFPIGTESDNLGLLFNVEPKLKVANNTFMGLRLGMAINTQTFESQNINQFIIDDEFDYGFLSIIPTCNYYWQKRKFSPYLGMGIGVYALANYIDVFRVNSTDPSKDIFEVKIRRQMGVLLRGGGDFGKIRMGLEYNFVPKAKIESPDGLRVGTVDSSYLGIVWGLIISS